MSTEYNQLIRNWHSKASDEDYFSKFVFEYLAFIAFLRQNEFPFESKDRDAIQKLKQNTDRKQQYLDLLSRDQGLRRTWTKLIEELRETPLWNTSRHRDEPEEIKWWNCSEPNLNAHAPQQTTNPKGTIADLNDWGNMVEFWHSIRNNLFHGTKDPQQQRNKLLLECAYRTLRPLVGLFLSETALL